MSEGVPGLADLPLRDDLRGMSPYGAPQLDVAVRLNTNENPWPPSEGLVADLAAAVARTAAGLNRYPDRDATQLRAALAAYLGHGLTVANVWAANGSNEILQQVCQAFGGPGRRAMGFEPSYSMHRLIAVGASTAWVSAHRAVDFTLSPSAARAAVAEARPDIVFLCSPNNPTGTALDADVVEAVLEVAPGMVVVDEAYAEFSARPSALALLPQHPRLVVTRTMSKAFAMAGARLGYLAAGPAVVEALQLVRLPYHLSALTQTAALVALEHTAELLGTVDAVKQERDRLAQAMRESGFTVVESDANFLLFGPFADSAAAWRTILDGGVLVRDVGLPGWLRVTAGLPAEGDAFLNALAPLSPAGQHSVVPEEVTQVERVSP